VSFEELFDTVYPALFRYCVRMTGDADLSEDVAQEAFVRLLERDVQGELPGLRAWLFKVATHLIRDRARVRDNRARLIEANPVEGVPPELPDAATESEERRAAVRSALNVLDERDRTLLVMREEGFGYRELAEAIGVQAASIGTLLARARSRFMEALERQGALSEEDR
jgi:RNA polymerase sigma factor (sigma-70 family)